MFGLSENMHVKVEVRSFNRFGAISTTPQKIWGSVTLAKHPFRKILRGHVRTVHRNMHVKSVALTVLNWSN